MTAQLPSRHLSADQAIAALPTGAAGPFPSDVPRKAVVIEDIRVIGGQ